MKKYFLIFIFICISESLTAQTNTFLSHSYFSCIEKDMHSIGINKHTSVKPFLFSNDDTLFFNSFKPLNSSKLVIYNFLNSNFISTRENDYYLALNPLFHFEIGKDNNRRYINTRGFEVKGTIGSKLSFYSSFYENQMLLPDYINTFIENHSNVVPGIGIAKHTSLKDGLIDLYYSSGYINYNINSFFDIQLGHGKNFIGDGYRTMFISDNAFNYPYLKVTTDVWKLKYINLFSYFQDVNFDIDAANISMSKFCATHYLSGNVGERLNIGIFESIMFGEDSIGNSFDINYLNPVIFYRPLEYSIGYSRKGNALLGFLLKYKLTSNCHFYAQLILDEFRLRDFKSQNGAFTNKYGGQLGFKYFDVFELENLSFQSELNFARPFTYSHFNPHLNYSHYAQPLAHPLGTSFIENVSIVRYRKNRWLSNLKIVLANHGGEIEGDSTNYGSDIFIPYNENYNETGNNIAQGNSAKLRLIDFRLGYIINPKTNMKFEVGIVNRSFSDKNSFYENQYIFFAFKTDLHNFYYDF
tara:strand:+ start:23419 stop:24996 length:1578 start_codon:yes stop_codon:yes gene_type:complete